MYNRLILSFAGINPEFVKNRLRGKIAGTIAYTERLLETEPVDTKLTGCFDFVLSNHVLHVVYDTKR